MRLKNWCFCSSVVVCLPQHGHENWCQDCGWQFTDHQQVSVLLYADNLRWLWIFLEHDKRMVQAPNVCLCSCPFIWNACDVIIDLTVCTLVLHSNTKVLHLRINSVKKCVLILFSCLYVICLALYFSKHTWNFSWKYWENHKEKSVGVAGNSVEIPVITSRIQIRDVTAVRINYVILHHKL
jgi:hypothetical protein